jgi:hypothetical protein
LSWAAHTTLWRVLEEHAEHVRYHRRLGGVRPLSLPDGPDEGVRQRDRSGE